MEEIALYFTTAGLALFCILGIIQFVYHLKTKRQIKKLSEMRLYHLQEKLECERENFEDSLKRTMIFFLICSFVGLLGLGAAEIFYNADQLWAVIEKSKFKSIIKIAFEIVGISMLSISMLSWNTYCLLLAIFDIEDADIKAKSAICAGIGGIIGGIILKVSFCI